MPVDRIKTEKVGTIDDDFDDYEDIEQKYLNQLKPKHRKKLLKLEEEVNKINNEKPPNKYKILEMDNIDLKTKALLISKNETLDMMDDGNGEYFKIKEWIESLIRVPFGKYYEMPVKIPNENVAKKRD